MTSQPLIKSFRGRPRAVVIMLCKAIVHDDAGTTLNGTSFDVIVGAQASLRIWTVIQGRVTFGDAAEASVTLPDSKTVYWSSRHTVRRVENPIGVPIEFDASALAEFPAGKYHLSIR